MCLPFFSIPYENCRQLIENLNSEIICNSEKGNREDLDIDINTNFKIVHSKSLKLFFKNFQCLWNNIDILNLPVILIILV